MQRPDLTVYHDGSCPLCRLEIGHYRRQAGAERIEFVDVSNPHPPLGPGLTDRAAMGRFHVRLPAGELKSGAAAFVEIWKLLPRWKPAARLAQMPGAMGMFEIGYKAFAPCRPAAAEIVSRLGWS